MSDSAPPTSPATRVVVIEDNDQVRDLLTVVLQDAGYVVTGAEDGTIGLAAIEEGGVGLVLLDYNLPGGVTGLDVCRRIRSQPATAQIPIIVLTAVGDDELELSFLHVGADDYIRKTNFKADILLGRIEAVLRRVRSPASQAIEAGPLVLHPARREVLVEGRPKALTPTEFDILYKLVANPQRALSRRELLDRGDGDPEGVDRTVDVHVLSIRRKLGTHAWLVSTVWGVGYRLGAEPEG